MDLALKPNTDAGGGHDIAFVDGDFQLVAGDEAVAQEIALTLRTFLGESPYDRSIGIPYLEIIFQRGVSAQAIRFIVEQAILGVPGVADVLKLEVKIDHETRAATATGTARLSSGGTVDFATGVQQ